MDKEKHREINPPIADLTSRANRILHSRDLFGEGNLVLIQHNKDWYRLMITKQGKLLLTK